MKLARRVARLAGAGLAAVAAACSTSPSMPTTSLVAAHPTSPSTSSTFSYYNQPVTLVATTGVATGGASPASTVEVATDAGFTTIVSTQPLAAGQSTITLDHLSPATTYYWRVKTSAGDNPGTASSPQTFSIGPLLVIQSPLPVQPLADTFPHKRPTFTVTNATHTGPNATLTYRFDVAADAAFSNVVTSGTMPEGSGQTSFVPTVDLTPGSTYYWRAEASDATKAVTGPYSTVLSFTTVNPDDGTFRYTLTLHLISAVNCSRQFDPGPAPPDISFDGELVVSGDGLQYSSGDPKGYGIALNLQRDHGMLSGTLGGLFVWPGARATIGIQINETVASGSNDILGRLTGAARGLYVAVGFPNEYDCDGQTGFALVPHQ